MLQEVAEGTHFPLLVSWLRSYSKNLIDEGDLSYDIAFLRIFDLTLANHVHRLILISRNNEITDRQLASDLRGLCDHTNKQNRLSQNKKCFVMPGSS